MSDIEDVYAPALPGSLMRCALLDRPGKFRLARRDCELYSVQIINAGDWGRLWAKTGRDRSVFHQPSTFTGSFVLGGGCEDGLIMELHSIDTFCVEINWREPDRSLI